MQKIKLKSNVNWVTHTLIELTPICTKTDDEIVFKYETDYNVEFLRDDGRTISTVVFDYGPVFHINSTENQLGLKLKEICPAYDEDGVFVYYTLIFEK